MTGTLSDFLPGYQAIKHLQGAKGHWSRRRVDCTIRAGFSGPRVIAGSGLGELLLMVEKNPRPVHLPSAMMTRGSRVLRLAPPSRADRTSHRPQPLQSTSMATLVRTARSIPHNGSHLEPIFASCGSAPLPRCICTFGRRQTGLRDWGSEPPCTVTLCSRCADNLLEGPV